MKNYIDQKYEFLIFYFDIFFERIVRILEFRILMLSGVEIRKNKLIVFNDQGDLIVVLFELGFVFDVFI